MSTDFTTGPADDTAVTAALRAVMALDGMQQAAFAARLSAIDPRFADGLGVLIMDAVGLIDGCLQLCVALQAGSIGVKCLCR